MKIDVYKRQAVGRDLGFDLSKLNVNGGASALGHPVLSLIHISVKIILLS